MSRLTVALVPVLSQSPLRGQCRSCTGFPFNPAGEARQGTLWRGRSLPGQQAGVKPVYSSSEVMKR
jgi:hypothetical protein